MSVELYNFYILNFLYFLQLLTVFFTHVKNESLHLFFTSLALGLVLMDTYPFSNLFEISKISLHHPKMMHSSLHNFQNWLKLFNFIALRIFPFRKFNFRNFRERFSYFCAFGFSRTSQNSMFNLEFTVCLMSLAKLLRPFLGKIASSFLTSSYPRSPSSGLSGLGVPYTGFSFWGGKAKIVTVKRIGNLNLGNFLLHKLCC